MELEQYEKMAEAILFAGGEPVEQKTVAAAMELDEEAAVTVLESLRRCFALTPSGSFAPKKSTSRIFAAHLK